MIAASAIGMVGIVAGGFLAAVVAFALAVLLFRAACDLTSVEPPGLLKSCLVVPVIGIICSPIVFGVLYGFWALGEAFHLPSVAVRTSVVGLQALGETLHLPGIALSVLASLTCVPLCALAAGVLYIPLLRVGFVKGATIHVLQSLLGMLVSAVLILLTIGVLTIVQGIVRLI